MADNEILGREALEIELRYRGTDSRVLAHDAALRAEIQRLTESRDAISALLPDDAAHKHPETGVSLLDDVRDLTADRKRLTTERDEAMKRNQRQWDLIRFCRQELLSEILITEDEFDELAKDHAAVQRLEDYDEIRTRLEGELSASRESLAEMMIRQSFTTGHGDSVSAMVSELEPQLAALRMRLEAAERSANDYETELERHATDRVSQRKQVSNLQKAVSELEPRAAFGDQCWQDRCENAYVEQSVFKRETGIDTKRLEYWFGPESKAILIEDYLRGIREGWDVNRWRQFIDAAMAKETPTE